MHSQDWNWTTLPDSLSKASRVWLQLTCGVYLSFVNLVISKNIPGGLVFAEKPRAPEGGLLEISYA